MKKIFALYVVNSWSVFIAFFPVFFISFLFNQIAPYFIKLTLHNCGHLYLIVSVSVLFQYIHHSDVTSSHAFCTKINFLFQNKLHLTVLFFSPFAQFPYNCTHLFLFSFTIFSIYIISQKSVFLYLLQLLTILVLFTFLY